ncbi:hypothetical protein ACFOKF_07975 [Sphingobium rhizovicinum]|uniref:Uncharacterized protein n=1 Tax=Sphingobium rhizovicinum TaxID=432308 RepID=A0ABV7NEJ6_9SPHN
MASLAYKNPAETHSSDSRRLKIRSLGIAWTILVSLFVLWELWNYSGLFAKISEWQFAVFRKSWPAATFGLLSLLFALPGLFLVHITRLKKAQEEQDAAPQDPQQKLLDKANFWRLLLGRTSIFFAALAVLSLIATLFLPGGAQPVPITVGKEVQPRPANGATTLTGRIIFAQTTTLSQDLILTGKDTRFAPILPAEGAGPVRYVVQLAPYEGMIEGQPRDPVMSVSGTLMRNALPGPIRVLYNNAGIALADNVYVLYRYSGTMRRPYYVAAIQLGAAALLLLLLFSFQTRHIKKLRQRFEEADKATPSVG